jgi:hypothetical protein
MHCGGRKNMARTSALLSATTLFYLLGTASSTPALSATPSKHPGYLHALSDLRSARWLIQHRTGDAAVNEHENAALRQVEDAISDIKRAAIDDGRDLNDHPDVDAHTERTGRLNRALESLRQAREDVNQEEDDVSVRGLKLGSLKHIDGATDNIKEALGDLAHNK